MVSPELDMSLIVTVLGGELERLRQRLAASQELIAEPRGPRTWRPDPPAAGAERHALDRDLDLAFTTSVGA